MPDGPSLQIDDDWKRQAQEEKRRLAEQAERERAAASSGVSSPGGMSGTATGRTAARASRGVPKASFTNLVQTLLTQALVYLGDVAPRGSEPLVDLDMARLQVDTLGILEEKCRNNLDADEQRVLDAALYEARSRFASVAAQYIL
jgi:hypothetical protein